MDELIERVLRFCRKNQSTTETAIKALQMAVPMQLPEAYQQLMATYNGLEGFLSDDTYLVMWPVEQLLDLNKGYGFTDHVPYLFLFGSNGGDAGYAFDTRCVNMPVVEVPFVDLSPSGVVGKDFRDFLKHLSGGPLSSHS